MLWIFLWSTSEEDGWVSEPDGNWHLQLIGFVWGGPSESRTEGRPKLVTRGSAAHIRM